MSHRKRFMEWKHTLAGVWADTYWSVCRCFSMCFRNHTLCPKLCEESKTFTYHYYINTLHSLHQYPNIQIINIHLVQWRCNLHCTHCTKTLLIHKLLNDWCNECNVLRYVYWKQRFSYFSTLIWFIMPRKYLPLEK